MNHHLAGSVHSQVLAQLLSSAMNQHMEYAKWPVFGTVHNQN